MSTTKSGQPRSPSAIVSNFVVTSLLKKDVQPPLNMAALHDWIANFPSVPTATTRSGTVIERMVAMKDLDVADGC